eukprot:1900231-Rhodomonas_salina.2
MACRGALTGADVANDAVSRRRARENGDPRGCWAGPGGHARGREKPGCRRRDGRGEDEWHLALDGGNAVRRQLETPVLPGRGVGLVQRRVAGRRAGHRNPAADGEDPADARAS